MSYYSQLYHLQQRGHFNLFIQETDCTQLIQLKRKEKKKKNEASPKKAKEVESNLSLKSEEHLFSFQ